MATNEKRDINCRTCNKQQTVMKLCTRCKTVMYCSRDCQVKDWQNHRPKCAGAIQPKTPTANNFQTNDNSIFSEDLSSTKNKQYSSIHKPLVDFSKAVKQKESSDSENKSLKPDGKCYLFVNEYYTDVPEVDETQPLSSIIVKCNKEKHKLQVQNTWTGVEVYKFLSYKLSVPLEKIKIIHKGKVLSRETIVETLKDKAVYQVVGETAESEEGVDQRDISILMKQTGLDRNTAVQSLKKKGDLLDALLDQ